MAALYIETLEQAMGAYPNTRLEWKGATTREGRMTMTGVIGNPVNLEAHLKEEEKRPKKRKGEKKKINR